MFRHTIVALTALASVSAACSDASITGAAAGEATTEVRLHGDAPAGGNQSVAPASDESATEIQGTVEVAARVYLQSDAGEWVELTSGAAAEQSVEVSGEDGYRLLARAEVEARTYERVRVVFERVEGEFDGQVEIGLGGEVISAELDLGSEGELVVERDIAMNAGADTRLDIDLNAGGWASEAASSGVIARGDFASAVAISAH